MAVKYISEEYTSQTCPNCGNRYKPSGRNYSWVVCGFEAHRDAVGAYNIRTKYVSEETEKEVSSCLPGVMASPSGVRFHPHLQCSSRSRPETNEPTGSRKPV